MLGPIPVPAFYWVLRVDKVYYGAKLYTLLGNLYICYFQPGKWLVLLGCRVY